MQNNPPNSTVTILLALYYDTFELTSEHIPAIETTQCAYFIEMIEKIYHIYISSAICLDSKAEEEAHKMMTSINTCILAAELMWLSYFAMQNTYGLTSLSISLGVAVTKPEYINIPNNGLFKYQINKKRVQKNHLVLNLRF